MSTEGLTVEDVADLANCVRNKMNEVLLDISKELPINSKFASVTSYSKSE